jgi:predicted RNA binding protein YcfA (HicA-like mRNA interferase family)
LAALLRIGREVAWQKGSHCRLKRAGWPNYTFAFHDDEEVGFGLLAQIDKKTGLQPEDL